MGQSEDRGVDVERFERAVVRTHRRLRLQSFAGALAKWAPIHVLFLTPWTLSYRFEIFSSAVFFSGALLAVGSLLALGLRASLHGPGLLAAALKLDAAHELRGRLTGALEFLGFFRAGPSSEVSPNSYQDLAIRDLARLSTVSSVRAAPWTMPEGAIVGALMTGLLTVLVLVPLKSAPVLAVEEGVELSENEAWVSPDDAELLARQAKDLQNIATTNEGQVIAERFNEIVLRAVAGEISQQEALRLAAGLEAEIDGAAREAEALREGLKKRGESLAQRRITSEVGKALKEGRYKDAEEALRKLAERLSSSSDGLSERELQELREALEATRNVEEIDSSKKSQAPESGEKERAALQEKQQRLLKKKNTQGLSQAEEESLKQTERRLKSLDRRKKSDASEKQETLSKLDRELAEAAKALQKEREKSGDFLDQAAQSVQKGTQKKLSDDEKKAMLKQLKALKERLRRQNQQGKRAQRLRDFQNRARGKGKNPQGPQGSKPGSKGSPKPGEMRLGPGGAKVPLPGQGEAPGQGEKPGQSGKKPGQGHDPRLTGDATELPEASAQDVSAVAQDSGSGESASETILSVAEEGFTSSSYEKLFREYETVAEEVMEKDAIPPGRKDHVLRYFELIRPRRGQAEQGE